MAKGNARSEQFTENIRKAVDSHYPLVYVVGPEEDRIVRFLAATAESHYGDSDHFHTWTTSNGFDNPDWDNRALRDPVAALEQILAEGEDGFYLMKDLPSQFESSPLLVRTMRDFYYQVGDRNLYVFFSHPVGRVPEELKKEIFVTEMSLPTEREVYNYLAGMINAANGSIRVDSHWLRRFTQSVRGLTMGEIGHLFRRLTVRGNFDLHHALSESYQEKAQMLLKESCLRVIPDRLDLDSIGGLHRLKDWVNSRKILLGKDAQDQGVPLPSGVLFMGISGCGKSLAAKTIASAWDLQLIRLDMNLVLSGMYGSPEYAFDRATRIAESIAPVVLWIDEMENSFGYDDDNASGRNVNVFSSFLTWMQEKPAGLFVAATANRINKLPAEMIRKGRFDQVFFIDLPDDQAREEIFRIHISNAGGEPGEFDYGVLTLLTEGWSGAEIEQVVKAARIEAFNAGRPFNQQDISLKSSSIIPLSRTMKEQFNQLRSWSMDRATPA
jgi:hypothetical protein